VTAIRRALVGAVALASIWASSVAPAPARLPTIAPADATARPGPIARGSDAEARRLVGTRAPSLPRLAWLDGETRTTRSLAGRVVLVRSFTNACPFCAASLPAIERIHADYAERGLVVLGVYHPKPPRAVSEADVVEFARSFGVTFPVAIDPDWRLVRKWWLDESESAWTSITWILDRDGAIRAVHPGGEFHEGGGPDHARCNDDERETRRVIEGLLAGTREGVER
jgi:peroxiredoxin